MACEKLRYDYFGAPFSVGLVVAEGLAVWLYGVRVAVINQ